MLTNINKNVNIKKYQATDKKMKIKKEEISQMTRENKSKKVKN